MEAVIGLIVPFIAIAIVAKGTDVMAYFIENILSKIPGLPDRIEPAIAFILVFGINFAILYLGNFDLFLYLLFDWDYPILGNIVTALFVSAGSRLLRESFGLISEIPININNASTIVRALNKRGKKKKEEIEIEENKNIEEEHIYYNPYHEHNFDYVDIEDINMDTINKKDKNENRYEDI